MLPRSPKRALSHGQVTRDPSPAAAGGQQRLSQEGIPLTSGGCAVAEAAPGSDKVDELVLGRPCRGRREGPARQRALSGGRENTPSSPGLPHKTELPESWESLREFQGVLPVHNQAQPPLQTLPGKQPRASVSQHLIFPPQETREVLEPLRRSHPEAASLLWS